VTKRHPRAGLPSGVAYSIVQYTAEHTNVLDRTIGDHVNLESDILMRYVKQAVEAL
jgi:riboflavin synthase alpha subunit